jgi:hypothetical protein
LHQTRLIEAIRSTMWDPESAAAEIRAAARVLEASGSLAELLGAVLTEGFPAEMIARAARRPGPEERAWLTLAAAGARRTRQCLAWRASQALDAGELAAALASAPRGPRRACRRRAAGAGSAEERAAWLLLATLRRGELRRLAEGRPAIAVHYRKLRSGTACSEARSPHGRAAAPVLG